MAVIITFALGILSGAFGSILLKMGVTQIGPIEINSLNQLFVYLYKLFTNILSLSGFILYFASGVIWSYLLTKLDISFVQPILALTYVITPILAIFFLSEHISILRWGGIAVIVLGVFIVSRTL